MNDQNDFVNEFMSTNTEANLDIVDEVAVPALAKLFHKAPQNNRNRGSQRFGELSKNPNLVRFDAIVNSIIMMLKQRPDLARVRWEASNPSSLQLEFAPGFLQKDLDLDTVRNMLMNIVKSRHDPHVIDWELGSEYILITYPNPSVF